jgi:hypothetical protein
LENAKKKKKKKKWPPIIKKLKKSCSYENINLTKKGKTEVMMFVNAISEDKQTTSFTRHIGLKCDSFGASLNSFHEGKFNRNLSMMVLKRS